MEISIVIAKTLGVYLIAGAVFLIFRGKTFPAVLKDLFDHRATMWLAGLFLIVIGGVIVFGGSDNMVVTVLGWLTLGKGIIYIVYPDIFKKIVWIKARSATVIFGILYLALGVWIISL